MIRNNNKFPRDDSSRKSISNQNVPKTPAEFDYDLWTTVDGKCMVRVKRTGEVSEVAREVFRLLRAEEKRLRRQCSGRDSEECEDEIGHTIPFDTSVDWIEDSTVGENDLLLSLIEDEFMATLTPLQREVYQVCIKQGVPEVEYARTVSKSASCICRAKKRVKTLAEKFFRGGC